MHLDKAGLITDTNTGEGMWYLFLYRYNGDFFITSFIIDFNDKEFEGWRVYALGENERAFFSDIYYEKIDSVIVFDKELDRSSDYYYGGVCGTLDFNNDGIDDLTNVFMLFPSNRYPHFCDYKFVDGATGRLLDFTKYFSAQTDLCRIFLYRHDDGPATKNYFVCLLGGHGNYVIKLIEIRGTEPIELHSWLVSVENRIMVKASEGESALWG